LFNDVAETLKQFLIGEIPIERNEIDVSFERPSREWSSKLSRPTLNLFLFDIRERKELRDGTFAMTRTADGRAIQTRPPRRVDLTYLVTAWTREADDEHRILGRTLAAMYRTDNLPDAFRQGYLQFAETQVPLRVTSADHVARPHDLWGVLDNELRASITWVTTVPIDAFEPIVGPLVRTAELEFGRIGEDWRETPPPRIAGLVHAKGDPLVGISGARVSLKDTAFSTTTNESGLWVFDRVPHGSYVAKVETGDGSSVESAMNVPSESYDIEL